MGHQGLRFRGCRAGITHLTSAAADMIIFNRSALSVPASSVCSLDTDFHFCVTFPCISARASAGRMNGGGRALVWHWPGKSRKPWLHAHGGVAETLHDREWWEEYHRMCHSSGTCVLNCSLSMLS